MLQEALLFLVLEIMENKKGELSDEWKIGLCPVKKMLAFLKSYPGESKKADPERKVETSFSEPVCLYTDL